MDGGESVFNGHTPGQFCRVNSIDHGVLSAGGDVLNSDRT